MVKRIIIIVSAVLAVVVLAVVGIVVVGDLSAPRYASGAIAEGPTTEDEDFGVVSVYTVDDEGDLDPAADGLTEHVWDTFTRVATDDFVAETMIEYQVGDAPKSDTLAAVFQSDDPEYWVLSANLATSTEDSDLIPTLVHEYAHLLTLDGTQMNPGVKTCRTVELSEGCALGDSYLWDFEQEFWAEYSDAPAPDNSDEDVAYEFYLEHEDDFVSDYAATNVVEDLAESFMTFVLEDRPDSESTVARKLEFFWQYQEFIEIRERIRTEFQSDLGLVG